MQRTLISILGMASMACGQDIAGGTINGKAIPSALFRSPRVCDSLRSTIRDAARDQAVQDMGVTVTPEDIAAAKMEIKFPDPVADSKFAIEQETMMVSALTAVDKGQNPDQVYKDMLQPKGVLPEVWASYQRQWKDPQGRKTIQTRLTWTPDVIARAQASFNFEPYARNQKLDQMVDEKLAAADPTFRTALEHWNIPRPNGRHGLPASEKQYLDQQRAMYWRVQEAKVNVVLNDPSLAGRCGLATK